MRRARRRARGSMPAPERRPKPVADATHNRDSGNPPDARPAWHTMMARPRFTPEIDLGHVIQAIVVLITIGGSVLGGFLSLRADLAMQRAEFASALKGHEVKLAEIERRLDERRTEQRQFRAETRNSLRQLVQGLADLHIELAQRQNRNER